MPWGELKKAKADAHHIEQEIARLLREHDGLTKKDIARHNDTLATVTDRTIERVEEEIDELREHLANHRRDVAAKATFLRRHYKAV